MVGMTRFRSVTAYMLVLALRLQRLLFQRASRRGRQPETTSLEAREQVGPVSSAAQVDRIPDELDRRAADRLPDELLRDWGEDAERRKSSKVSPEVSAWSLPIREPHPPSASQEGESSANCGCGPKIRVDNADACRMVEECACIRHPLIILFYIAQNESPAGGLISRLKHAYGRIVSCAAAFNTLVAATLVLLAVLAVGFDINILNLVEVLR